MIVLYAAPNHIRPNYDENRIFCLRNLYPK